MLFPDNYFQEKHLYVEIISYFCSMIMKRQLFILALMLLPLCSVMGKTVLVETTMGNIRPVI